MINLENNNNNNNNNVLIEGNFNNQEPGIRRRRRRRGEGPLNAAPLMGTDIKIKFHVENNDFAKCNRAIVSRLENSVDSIKVGENKEAWYKDIHTYIIYPANNFGMEGISLEIEALIDDRGYKISSEGMYRGSYIDINKLQSFDRLDCFIRLDALKYGKKADL